MPLYAGPLGPKGNTRWAALRSAKFATGAPAELVLNGGFSTDTNWTKVQASIASGVATVASPDGSFAAVHQSIPLVLGRSYQITFDIPAVTSGDWAVALQSGVNKLAGSTPGSKSLSYKAEVGGNEQMAFKRGSAVATSFTVDNVSVKELDP